MPFDVDPFRDDGDTDTSIDATEIAISNTRFFLEGLPVTDLTGRGHVRKHLADLEKRLARLLKPPAIEPSPKP